MLTELVKDKVLTLKQPAERMDMAFRLSLGGT